MGLGTKIDYAHATWSPWIGCSECSPGCTHCYARDWAKRFPRFRGHWGPDAPRYFFGESHWKQPLAWNRKAQREGTRYRVLVSLCDVFECLPASHPQCRDSASAFMRLWQLIRATSFLDWLLPTKRPENLDASPYLDVGGQLLPNLWLGVTAESQQQADERIPLLLEVPAAVRWVSYEPALGAADLRDWLTVAEPCNFVPFTPEAKAAHGEAGPRQLVRRGIDWVVIGCETGPGARPMKLAWADAVVAQCRAAGVPVFTKQLRIHGQLLRSDKLAEKGWPVQYPEVRK